MFESIQNKKVIQAKGTYSPAVKLGDFICVSGQLPLDSEGKLVSDDICEQTKQCIANLDAVLKTMDLDLRYVMNVRLYMTDIKDIDKVNTVYNEMFRDPYPARSCIGVGGLQDGAKIQIEAYAIDTRALEILCSKEECANCDAEDSYCQTDWS